MRGITVYRKAPLTPPPRHVASQLVFRQGAGSRLSSAARCTTTWRIRLDERKKLAERERELKLPAEEATSAMKVITVRQC